MGNYIVITVALSVKRSYWVPKLRGTRTLIRKNQSRSLFRKKQSFPLIRQNQRPLLFRKKQGFPLFQAAPSCLPCGTGREELCRTSPEFPRVEILRTKVSPKFAL